MQFLALAKLICSLITEKIMNKDLQPISANHHCQPEINLFLLRKQ